jgi:hypothetical protein
MDWLDVQLQQFRDRGMQVWLTGHVPPHPGLYYDNCCECRVGQISAVGQNVDGHQISAMVTSRSVSRTQLLATSLGTCE